MDSPTSKKRSISMLLHSVPSQYQIISPRPRKVAEEETDLCLHIPSPSNIAKRTSVDIRNIEQITQVCDVMSNESVRNDLKRYAEIAHSEEAILFWEAVHLKFKASKTSKEKIREAKNIVKTFFECDSKYELNTSLSKKVEIIDKIERGDVDDTLFDSMELEIAEEGGILQDVYRRYRSSYGLNYMMPKMMDKLNSL